MAYQRHHYETLRKDSVTMDMCDAECSACLLYQHASFLSADLSNTIHRVTNGDYFLLNNEPYTFSERVSPAERGRFAPRAPPENLPRPSEAPARQKSPKTSAVCHKEAFSKPTAHTEAKEYETGKGSLNNKDSLKTGHELVGRLLKDYTTEAHTSADCRQTDNRSSGRLNKSPESKKYVIRWLTELAAGKLAKRKRIPSRDRRPDKRGKIRKKPKVLRRKGVQLFGPQLEDTQLDDNNSRVTELVDKLDTEVADLKRDGVRLSKQMWLLFSSFEEYLRSRYPEAAAGIKRYAKTGNKVTCDANSHEIRSKQAEIQNGCLDTNRKWIDESCHLYANVAEVSDWLRPYDECDDWSDDSDRVRKLTETDQSAAAQHTQAEDTEVDENGNERATVDGMNILWYTKLRKIDKSSTRHYRNRTPERKQWRSQCSPTETNSTSEKIDTPVRRPEDLFSDVSVYSDSNTGAERLSRKDYPSRQQANPEQLDDRPKRIGLNTAAAARPDSPVTISSGYDSDRDSVLYGPLPEQRKTTEQNREENKSPLYVAMDNSSELYQNLKNCRRSGYCLQDNTKRSTDRDTTGASQDNEDIAFTVRSHSDLSASLDCLLGESEMGERIKWRNGIKAIHSAGLNGNDEDTTSVYENLPAALYAQVSPPKPQTVYTTPTCLKADPVWESTPLDSDHKPKIMNASGASDTTTGSQLEESLRSQIRKRIGQLLDDRSASQTPYKSAFRPYNKALYSVMTNDSHAKQQDQSIAELRRTNNAHKVNGHYLDMNPSVSAVYFQKSPSLHSIMVTDVSVQPANPESSILERTGKRDAGTGADKSPDSGHDSNVTCDVGSPPVATDAFRNVKDSCIVYREKHANANPNDTSESELNVSSFNNTYETIPADIETFWKDRTEKSDGTPGSEHTYCRIDDIPTMLEPEAYFRVPEPPPCSGRYALGNATRGQAIRNAVPEQVKLTRPLPQRVAPASDAVTAAGLHTYTVSDVLHSFAKYAGHLMPNGPGDDLNSDTLRIPAPEAFRQPEAPKPSVCKDQTSSREPKPVAVDLAKAQAKYGKSTKTSASHPATDGGRAEPAATSANIFTPDLSNDPHSSGVPGPLYSAGGGVRLAAIKKTLSFREATNPSDGSPGPRAKYVAHFRQHSEPTPGGARSGRPSRHPRSFCAGVADDYTPTVIDGLQSYQTTPTDVTTELILTPPSAFRSPSPPAEDHLYENIRDMEIMRENRRRALEEGRAFRVTPRHRSQSALQIHRLGLAEGREIFC